MNLPLRAPKQVQARGVKLIPVVYWTLKEFNQLLQFSLNLVHVSVSDISIFSSCSFLADARYVSLAELDARNCSYVNYCIMGV